MKYEDPLTDEEIGDYLAEIQLEEMKIKKWEEEENAGNVTLLFRRKTDKLVVGETYTIDQLMKMYPVEDGNLYIGWDNLEGDNNDNNT